MRLQLEVWARRIKAVLRFAYNATQLVAALFGILGITVGGALIAWYLQNFAIVIPLVTFALGLITASTLVFIVYWRTSAVKWLMRGYRWIKAEYLYTIDNDNPQLHTQYVTILLEAIRPGVDHFENRYLWSGRGQIDDPLILSPGHKLMGMTQRAVWSYYYVDLGHEMRVGERVEIRIQQNLFDFENKFEPFLAKTLKEPLDELILHVQIPNTRFPSVIHFNEEDSPPPLGSLLNNESVGEIDKARGDIRWLIHSPVFGRRYEIRWVW